jgi:hypothetical protein
MANQFNSVGIYDIEINLRLRLIEEENTVNGDPDRLLDVLLDAVRCGEDSYLETTDAEVRTTRVVETDASPQMRQKLLWLRNQSA